MASNPELSGHLNHNDIMGSGMCLSAAVSSMRPGWLHHCTDPMLIGDKIQQQPHGTVRGHGDTRPVLTCEVVLVVFFIKHEKNIVDSRYGDTSLLYYVDTMCTDDGWV